MTMLSNSNPLDLAKFTPSARDRDEEEEILNSKAAMARAEGAYQQTLLQSRVVAAACFFIGAAIAVAPPIRSPGLMVLLVAVAVFISGSGRWFAQRSFHREMSRASLRGSR